MQGNESVWIPLLLRNVRRFLASIADVRSGLALKTASLLLKRNADGYVMTTFVTVNITLIFSTFLILPTLTSSSSSNPIFTHTLFNSAFQILIVHKPL